MKDRGFKHRNNKQSLNNTTSPKNMKGVNEYIKDSHGKLKKGWKDNTDILDSKTYKTYDKSTNAEDQYHTFI